VNNNSEVSINLVIQMVTGECLAYSGLQVYPNVKFAELAATWHWPAHSDDPSEL